MRLFRFALLLTMVAASALFASAQKAQKSQAAQCALKQAPQFRGFHLGMTTLDVRDKLEDTTLFDINVPKTGAGSHSVRISAAELKEELAEGIDEINLAFVDGKLAVIKVTYSGAQTWDNGQDFINKTSESLGLPKPSETSGNGSSENKGNEKYRYECKGFAVAMAYSYGVSPSFTINDTEAQKLADKRLDDEGPVKRITIGPGTTTVPIRKPN